MLRFALEEILLYGLGSLHVMRRIREVVIDLESAAAPPLRPSLTVFLRRIAFAATARPKRASGER